MNLFNYLMNKNDKNLVDNDHMLEYLLNKSGTEKEVSGTEINITDVTKAKIIKLTLDKESTQETTTGKNIFNPANIEGTKNGITYSYDNDTHIYTLNGTATADNTVINSIALDTIDLTKGSPTLSVHYISGSCTGGLGQFLTSDYAGLTVDLSNLSSSNPISSRTSTTIGTTTKFNSRFRFNTGDTLNNFKFKIMVANTTDTTYEPYTGGQPSPSPDYPQEVKTVTGNIEITITDGTNTRNYTIPLGNNEIAGIGDYKDELIVDKNGKCWLNKKTGKVVLDGSENWSMLDSSIPFKLAINNLLLPISKNVVPFVLSDYYKVVAWNTLSTAGDYCLSVTSTESNLRIRNNDITTLADFKSWLSTHNVTIYHALETSQLIDLNYTVDLTLFEGVNNISNSDDMDMTLKYY